MKTGYESWQNRYRYFNVGDFELRFGKFNDPNEWSNGEKQEIRILTKDIHLSEALLDKLLEMLSDGNIRQQ